MSKLAASSRPVTVCRCRHEPCAPPIQTVAVSVQYGQRDRHLSNEWIAPTADPSSTQKKLTGRVDARLKPLREFASVSHQLEGTYLTVVGHAAEITRFRPTGSTTPGVRIASPRTASRCPPANGIWRVG